MGDWRWDSSGLPGAKILEDPNIYLAAYNFGIRKVLEYIESGRDLPKQIEQYVKKVATYNTVFNTIENYGTLIEWKRWNEE